MSLALPHRSVATADQQYVSLFSATVNKTRATCRVKDQKATFIDENLLWRQLRYAEKQFNLVKFWYNSVS